MIPKSINGSKVISLTSGALLGILWMPLSALIMAHPVVPTEVSADSIWLRIALEFSSYVVAISAIALIAALSVNRWVALEPALFFLGYLVTAFAVYLSSFRTGEIALVVQEPMLWVYPLGTLVSALATTSCWSLVKARET